MREGGVHDDQSSLTRPLVVVAALRRTGSTLLAEALTELPHAFVFREPKLFRGRTALKQEDVAQIHAETAVRLSAPVSPGPRDPVAATRRFTTEVLAPLSRSVEQLGIKEVRYGPRWREVLDALGQAAPLRVVALARDPRDMYLSLAHRARERRVPLAGEFGPAAVAADIVREWEIQRDVIAATDALAVRYEDLCTDPEALARILRFVGSPLTRGGTLGAFKPLEHAVHGGKVTELSVGRWRREHDRALVAAATETRDRLGDYCRFWGYPT